jgi:hypothetical protein
VLRNNGWHGYDGLVDVEYEKAFRVNKDCLEGDLYSLTEIDRFWSFARHRLEKFNGITNRTFILHLKECEWRFNKRDRNLYAEILELLRQHPI